MDKKIFGYIFAFSMGAAVSSVITWKMLKTKYEQITQEEIDSVKEKYSVPRSTSENEESETQSEPEPETVNESDEDVHLTTYTTMLKDNNYVPSENDAELEDDLDKPYIITPDEFGEYYDYDTVTLYYYADGILTDDQDIAIEDVENVVGLDFPEHYGEYEEDCVYVRNNRLESDYEILMDVRPFADAMKNLPPLQEG